MSGMNMKRSTRALIMSVSNSEDNICRVCFKPGVLRVTEKQQNGTVIAATHPEDGTTHTWLKYNSLLLNAKKSKAKRIVCPRCHKRGFVTEYRPDSSEPLKTAYIVKHERLEGEWGITKKTRKVRRCFIHTKEDMDIIKKKLGRYIPSPETDVIVHGENQTD